MTIYSTGYHGPSGNPSGAQCGIIQIKQTIYKTDQTFNTHNSFFDSGMTCSITPTASSNHVFVWAQLTIQPHNHATLMFRALRGSTVLDVGVSGGGTQTLTAGTQASSMGAYPGIQVLDTGIATTSSQTYKIQVLCSADCRINGRDTDYRGCSVLTLMEVSA